MKLNLKKLMFVLTVAMITSVNFVEAKTVTECVTNAKCRKTLTEELKKNGYANIAEALEKISDPDNLDDIKKAGQDLSFSEKIAIKLAYNNNKEKIKEIIKKK